MIMNISGILENTALISLISFALKELLLGLWDYWSEAIEAYYLRPFDVDRNPETKDWCKIHNEGNGNWDTVALTTTLTLKKVKNGVYIYYYDDNWEEIGRERVSFAKWKHYRRIKLKELPDFTKKKSNQ